MPGSTETPKTDIVCILGMHRSGTSLLARMLNLMGVALGPDEFLMPSSSANPKGYWEHQQFVTLNDEILGRLGGSWGEPPNFPEGWETDPTMEDLKQRARTLIQDSFGNAETWGWKDPRNCLTLRFWQQLLPEMRYVVCLRNPVDVAASLEHRDGFSAEKSSDLWLTYVESALEQSEGKPRIVVFYEDLMDDCFGELERLAGFLEMPELAQQADVKAAVQDFLEKGLEHSRTSMVQAAGSPTIAARTKARYLAHRIAVSLSRRQGNGDQGLDRQIEEALDLLSQSAFKPEQLKALEEHAKELANQLAESGNTIETLQVRHAEQQRDLEANSVRSAKNEQAIKMLSTELAEKVSLIDALSTQLIEKNSIVDQLSTQLGEQDLTHRIQAERAAERIASASAQLFNTQAELQKITDTLGWRVMKRYGRIKYRYLLPVYRLFGQKP